VGGLEPVGTSLRRKVYADSILSCGGGLLAADTLYAAVGFAGKCLLAVSEFYPAGINRKNLLCVQCINLPNLAANGWRWSGIGIRKPLEP